MKDNIIKKVPGESSWVSWIKRRIHKNLNFLCITTGPTGSGKSFADLSIAYEIDPEFDVRQQVAFSLPQFMRAINKFNGIDKSEEAKILQKKEYKVILFDELQTAANKRDWQSKLSKMFLYLMSTFRHQNFIVLFNAPYEDFVDSATMKLIHARFECHGWNKKTEKSKVRAKILQYNGKRQKFYEHSLQVIRYGRYNKFDGFWNVKKPPKHLYEPYEEMKTAFTIKLNAQITREINLMEKKDNNPEKDIRKPLTDKQRAVMECFAKYNDVEKGYQSVSDEIGLTISTIHGHRILAEKKGFSVNEFIKNE